MPKQQSQQNAKAQKEQPKQQKAPKQKRLANNKTWFKALMPKSRYLENIRIGEIDLPFLFLVLVLLVFGMIMMYSASYAWAIHDNNPQDFYFKKQLFMAAIGLVVMMYLSSRKFDYHILRSPLVANGLFVICILLMILVHTKFFGVTDNGASRWIRIGTASKTFFTFQPSELMKLAVIIIFSAMISANHQKLKEKGGLLPYIAILAIAAGFTIVHSSGNWRYCPYHCCCIYPVQIRRLLIHQKPYRQLALYL